MVFIVLGDKIGGDSGVVGSVEEVSKVTES
jgi:hypothetical protein